MTFSSYFPICLQEDFSSVSVYLSLFTQLQLTLFVWNNSHTLVDVLEILPRIWNEQSEANDYNSF